MEGLDRISALLQPAVKPAAPDCGGIGFPGRQPAPDQQRRCIAERWDGGYPRAGQTGHVQINHGRVSLALSEQISQLRQRQRLHT